MLTLLAYVHFLLYFECTPRKRVPPRSYVREMQPILQIARNILQKRFDLIIRYPTLRFQASLSECCIAYEIDIYLFLQIFLALLAYVHFLLYLCSGCNLHR